MHKENTPLLHHKQLSPLTVSSYLITGSCCCAICTTIVLYIICMYSMFFWIPQTFINNLISGGMAHLSNIQCFGTDGNQHLAGLSLIHSLCEWSVYDAHVLWPWAATTAQIQNTHNFPFKASHWHLNWKECVSMYIYRQLLQWCFDATRHCEPVKNR